MFGVMADSIPRPLLQVNLLIENIVFGYCIVIVAEEWHSVRQHDIKNDAHAPHICRAVM
jgi:hypothetical protein